jgi:phosphoenolpyruvate carboxylase
LTQGSLRCSTWPWHRTRFRKTPTFAFWDESFRDVIRDLGGEALFRRIEYSRSTSVDRHRGIEGAHDVDRGLSALGRIR